MQTFFMNDLIINRYFYKFKVITKLVDDKFMAGGWYAIIEVGWSFLFSIIGKYFY